MKQANRMMLAALSAAMLVLVSCAPADYPGARNSDIPSPATADTRPEAINEKPDSVLYLPLGQDVLVPEVDSDDPLPSTPVGPFELRAETLAGALQLILADYDVPLAFETDEGLNRRITIANLRGPMNKVVRNVCGLADLYCAFQDGILTVKEKETFTVKIPPISQDANFMQNISTGLAAIVGTTPVVDQSTRTIIYQATNRTAEMAERYFQRMRTSTALIVFETYIWEVALNNGNSMGIKWSGFETFGKYASKFAISGAIGADFSNPISIGIPSAAENAATSTDVVQFLSTFGAVKTISQPQITVLSGSQAKLRAADTENYVARVAETIDNGQSTTSVDTASVDTGFTITIGSAWDNATVYANIEINLSDVSAIEDFDFTSGSGGSTTVQLPKTTEREVSTQVRIRPGDSLLLAGLVREADSFDKSGPGFNRPILPTSRTTVAKNVELVFMLRPRVIVFSSPSEQKRFNSVRELPNDAEVATGPVKGPAPAISNDLSFSYDFAPFTDDPVKPTPEAAKATSDDVSPAPAAAKSSIKAEPVKAAPAPTASSTEDILAAPTTSSAQSAASDAPVMIVPPPPVTRKGKAPQASGVEVDYDQLKR